ncbi:hypothetical protein RCL1_006116 [Eukaryota sp. TZLM3-RCL]
MALDFLHNVFIYRGAISPLLLFDLKGRYSGDEGYALDSTVSLLAATAMSLEQSLGSSFSRLSFGGASLFIKSFGQVFFVAQCASTTNEALLSTALSLAHKLLVLHFGPSYVIKSKSPLKRHSSTISCFINVAFELVFSDVSHFLNAIPAPILDQTIQKELESMLRRSCSALGNVAFHSFLFVETQQIASLLRSSVRTPPPEFSAYVYALTKLKLVIQQPIPPTDTGVLANFSECFVHIDDKFEQYGLALFPLSLSTEKPVLIVLLYNALEKAAVSQAAADFVAQAKKHLDLLICLALTIDKRSSCLPASASFPGLCNFVVVNRYSDCSLSFVHQGCASIDDAALQRFGEQEGVGVIGSKLVSGLKNKLTHWVVTCQDALTRSDTCFLIDRTSRFTMVFRLWFWVHSSGCVLDVPLPPKSCSKSSSSPSSLTDNRYKDILSRLKYRKVNITEVYAIFLSPLALDEILLCMDGLKYYVYSNYFMNSK